MRVHPENGWFGGASQVEVAAMIINETNMMHKEGVPVGRFIVMQASIILNLSPQDEVIAAMHRCNRKQVLQKVV